MYLSRAFTLQAMQTTPASEYLPGLSIFREEVNALDIHQEKVAYGYQS